MKKCEETMRNTALNISLVDRRCDISGGGCGIMCDSGCGCGISVVAAVASCVTVVVAVAAMASLVVAEVEVLSRLVGSFLDSSGMSVRQVVAKLA